MKIENDEDRLKVVEFITQTFTDGVDIKTLVRMYYDDRWNYFNDMSSEEIGDYLEESDLVEEFKNRSAK